MSELETKGNNMKTSIYGIEFREKSSKKLLSAIFNAESDTAASTRFKEWAEDSEYDVDFRTVKWAGSAVPLGMPNEVVVLYQTLAD